MRYVNHSGSCEGALTGPQKKFSCHKCGKLYNRKRGLSCHLKRCERDEPQLYVCSMCAKCFKRKNNLCKHEKQCKSIKSPNKSFKCRSCNVIFNNRKALYSHKVNQHGGADNNNVQNF